MNPNRILVIQTAFIGDVILSTSMVESLKGRFPDASIDFLLRKGNEQLFENNPNVSELLVWDKKSNKLKNMMRIVRSIRTKEYDLLINLQRYLSTGLFTLFAKAKYKVGFSQNPLSFCFNKKIPHIMPGGMHDIERNYQLISTFSGAPPAKPKLYPSADHYEAVKALKTEKFITIAPASVWFTKQFPKSKWIEFINQLEFDGHIHFVGAPGDSDLCNEIIASVQHKKWTNLCGQISLLESAALMKDAEMNYVNDSAPQHICSALDAPVTAIFCSTVPEFGFGPLSTRSRIVETSKSLDCRPCGLHGHRKCPKGHFECAMSIDVKELNMA